VAEAILSQTVTPLTDIPRFQGAGVYAIYYVGPFEPYEALSLLNSDGSFKQPIYVGKAIPEGSRKGGLSHDSTKGKALQKRLSQHAKSIRDAENLQLKDFYFRYLVVDDIWIPLGESMLIDRFRPLWNLVLDGFGNNATGSRREAQYQSLWDVLHPGRKFARRLSPNRLSQAEVAAMVKKHLDESQR
jgi:hypothetical protein